MPELPDVDVLRRWVSGTLPGSGMWRPKTSVAGYASGLTRPFLRCDRKGVANVAFASGEIQKNQADICNRRRSISGLRTSRCASRG
jgi:hypothetical protein